MNRSTAAPSISVDDTSKFSLELHAGTGRNCHNGTIFDFTVKKQFTVAKKLQIRRLTLIPKSHPAVEAFLPPWSQEYGKKFVFAAVPPSLADLSCATNGLLYLPDVITWTKDRRPVIELQLGSTRCIVEDENGTREYPLPELCESKDVLDIKAHIRIYGTNFPPNFRMKFGILDCEPIERHSRLELLPSEEGRYTKRQKIADVPADTNERMRSLLGLPRQNTGKLWRVR